MYKFRRFFKQFGLSLFFIVIITIVTAIAVIVVKNYEAKFINYATHESTVIIKNNITELVNDRIYALQRMAVRWGSQGGMSKNQWQQEAKLMIKHLTGLAVIEWVDNTYHVQFIEPLKGNESAQGLYILFDKAREQALKGSAKRGRITITPPLNLVQGYKAVIAYNPTYINNQFDGFIVGIFDINKLLKKVLNSQQSEDFAIELLHSGKVFYRSDKQVKTSFLTSKTIYLFSQKWQLTVWAKNNFINNAQTFLTEMLVILAIFLITLVIFFTVSSQMLKKKTIQLIENQKMLENTMEQLEIVNEDLEQFAFSASHDLKSPLKAITNLLSWLDEELEDVQTPESLSLTRRLYSRINRMENLLDDLLRYSRARHKLDEFEMIPAYNLLVEVTELLNVPAEFTVTFDEKLHDISIPKMPLSQVFHNLISNAIKHHHKPQGVINITYTCSKTHHQFHFSDDGPGIEPQYLSRIFEMFAVLQSRDIVEGSGIGLSLVKRIAQLYGGEILVSSKVGVGTSFCFQWPFQPDLS